MIILLPYIPELIVAPLVVVTLVWLSMVVRHG